jgi:predicted RNA binding protein YcfA (HicA-like mRNA interferase family)
MTHLPEITGKNLIRILKKDGWVIKSQKGSHVKMIKEGRLNFLIIPIHARSSIPKGTLIQIIKDAGFSVEQFIKFVKM